MRFLSTCASRWLSVYRVLAYDMFHGQIGLQERRDRSQEQYVMSMRTLFLINMAFIMWISHGLCLRIYTEVMKARARKVKLHRINDVEECTYHAQTEAWYPFEAIPLLLWFVPADFERYCKSLQSDSY